MIYRVTAQFKPATSGELRRKLGDGTIAAQQPDGQEMVDSLRRAVVTDSGDVTWSEQCFCQPPLAHERATMLDHHFDDIVAQPIEDYQEYEGRPFMEYLEAQPPAVDPDLAGSFGLTSGLVAQPIPDGTEQKPDEHETPDPDRSGRQPDRRRTPDQPGADPDQ